MTCARGACDGDFMFLLSHRSVFLSHFSVFQTPTLTGKMPPWRFDR